MATKGQPYRFADGSLSVYDPANDTIEECILTIVRDHEFLALYDTQDYGQVESLHRLPRGLYKGDRNGNWNLHKKGLLRCEHPVDGDRVPKDPHTLFEWPEVIDRIRDTDPDEVEKLRALIVRDTALYQAYREVLPFAASPKAQGCGPRKEGGDEAQTPERLLYEQECEQWRVQMEAAHDAWSDQETEVEAQYRHVMTTRAPIEDIDLDLLLLIEDEA